MEHILERIYQEALCATAKEYVSEREWQASVLGRPFSERDLLREAAWVILCSGFNEFVVRGRFDAISLCFCDWVSAEYISRRRARCRSTALAIFRNARKIDAILDVCQHVCERGFEVLSSEIHAEPLRELQKFPFIGPVTSCHLAKNLGINVAKPDRHLARLASELGFRSAHIMCAAVSDTVGEPVSVVDVVLWRYCTLQRSRISHRDGT